MKLLFITSKNVLNTSDGGDLCTNRNYASICEILGAENVETFDFVSEFKQNPYWRIKKRINYFLGYFEGLSREVINKIILKSKDKAYIYIDSSAYGYIAYALKKAKYEGKVITFFHNVEFNISLQKLMKNPLKFWELYLTYNNEKSAFHYSDSRIALNERDKNELIKIYGRKEYEIRVIPISLKDESRVVPINALTADLPTFIFVGNYRWYPNLHGVEWFINNVINNVDINFQIVGKGADLLRNKIQNPKVEIFESVPDLYPFMMNSDYVLIPIFRGGGMKVKTCEALMYGKNIIGTKEAFEGYDLDFTEVGEICNSKEEFIHAIKKACTIQRNKFNEYSRNKFLEKYSFEATLIQFEELLRC